MNERTAALLDGISPSSKILELGPSISPMAPRSLGWDVTVVDYATQEDLREKYRAHSGVDIDKIETVDVVWKDGPLHEAVPSQLHGTFDVMIASHVIEHIPDPIGFMASAQRLLHPERGILALAVPDKRWCFDCLKQVSTTGQMLAAHRAGMQRHGPATRFDFVAYAAFDNGRAGWDREPLSNLKLVHTLEQASATFGAWNEDPATPYEDFHAWHFTPASFELLVLELGAIGLLDWRVSWLGQRPGAEFLTRLIRGRQVFASPSERDERRLALLMQIQLDLREQSDWLPGPVSAARSAAVLETPAGPARTFWRWLLPVRRTVARLRGRA